MNYNAFIFSIVAAGSMLGILKASGRTSSYGQIDDWLVVGALVLIVYLISTNGVRKVKQTEQVLDTSLCYLLGRGLRRAFRFTTRRNRIK